MLEVKGKNSISEVIGQRIDLIKGKALCPFHSEKTPSFTVSEDKQAFFCFGCGASGDVIDFIQQYEHVGFKEAVSILGGDLTGQSNYTPPPPLPPPKIKKSAEVNLREHISDMHYADKQPLIDYLTGRGITNAPLSNDIGFIERCYNFKTKSFMPAMFSLVRDRQGKVVTGHRTFIETGDKLLTASTFDGISNGCAIRMINSDSNKLIVAEGQETLLSVYVLNGGLEANYWSTISSGGMSRLSIPSRFDCIEIYADFDLSGAGQKAAKELAERYDAAIFYPGKEVPKGKKGFDFNDLLVKR